MVRGMIKNDLRIKESIGESVDVACVGIHCCVVFDLIVFCLLLCLGVIVRIAIKCFGASEEFTRNGFGRF